MRAFRRLLCLVYLAVALPPAALPAQEAAPAGDDATLFTARDAWVAGAFAAGTLVMAPLDLAAARAVQDSLFQKNRWIRGAASGFRWLGHPGALLVAGSMYGIGRVAGRDRLADIGLHTGEAFILAELITGAGKLLAGRARPHMNPEDPFDFALGRGLRGDPYQSFPSGHTTAVFATAAALSSEIGEWNEESGALVGVLLYGGATLAGVSRMYHNQHWASDVVMGAAIGSFSGWKVSRYNHRNPGNRVDRWLLSVTLVPGGEAGVRWSWALLPLPAR